MKQFYIVTVTLAILGLAACDEGSGQKDNEQTTKPNIEARSNDGLKIAYYNQDSLQIYFKYYREQDSIVTKKQLSFQNEVQKRTSNLQNYIVRNDERARSGLLSENEIMKIQQTAQQMEAALMQYQQIEGSKLEKETYKKLEIIENKITAFSSEYCKENDIDILLIHAKGGQINYIHSSFDVTKEFTEYLNQKQAELEEDIEN